MKFIIECWILVFQFLICCSYSETVFDCGHNEKLEDEKCISCPTCPVGKGLSERCGFGSGGYLPCIICPKGKYNDNPEDNICIPCRDCTFHNRITQYHCRPVVNAECGGCLEGFYDNRKDLLHKDDHLYHCVPCTAATEDLECAGWLKTHTPTPAHSTNTDGVPIWKPISITLAVGLLVLIVVLTVVVLGRNRQKILRHLQTTRGCCCLIWLLNVWDTLCCSKQSRSRRAGSRHDEESLWQTPESQPMKIMSSEEKVDVELVKSTSVHDLAPGNMNPETMGEELATVSGDNAANIKLEASKLLQCGLMDSNSDDGQVLKSLDYKTKEVLPLKSVKLAVSDGSSGETSTSNGQTVLPFGGDYISRQELKKALLAINNDLVSKHDDNIRAAQQSLNKGIPQAEVQANVVLWAENVNHGEDENADTSNNLESSPLVDRLSNTNSELTLLSDNDESGSEYSLSQHAISEASTLLIRGPEDVDNIGTNGAGFSRDEAMAFTPNIPGENPVMTRYLGTINENIDLHLDSVSSVSDNVTSPNPRYAPSPGRVDVEFGRNSPSRTGLYLKRGQPIGINANTPSVSSKVSKDSSVNSDSGETQITAYGQPTNILVNSGIAIQVINYAQPTGETQVIVNEQQDNDNDLPTGTLDKSVQDAFDPDQTAVKQVAPSSGSHENHCGISGMELDQSHPSSHFPVQETCDGPPTERLN